MKSKLHVKEVTAIAIAYTRDLLPEMQNIEIKEASFLDTGLYKAFMEQQPLYAFGGTNASVGHMQPHSRFY